jgi:hypothetical protein
MTESEETMVDRVMVAIENANTCRNCGAYINGANPSDACCGRPNWDDATPEHRARAAIEAMREPTASMIAAGVAAYQNGDPGEEVSPSGLCDAFSAAIDEALADTPSTLEE